MFRSRVARKILFVISITLIIGFFCLGIGSLWVEYRETMEHSIRSARNMASIIVKGIDNDMMRGEPQVVQKHIADIKQSNAVLDLKVYTHEGRVVGAASSAEEDAMARESLSSGKDREKKTMIGQKHALLTAIPLPNEQRCQRCHNVSQKYTGVLFLATSLQEGHERAKMLAIMLSVLGFTFFGIILASMYFIFKRMIVSKIVHVSEKVDRIASGDAKLTEQVEIFSNDEIEHLANSVNRLTGRLGEIIDDLYNEAGDIAMSVCRVAQGSEDMVNATQQQRDQATAVAVATEEIAATISSISENVHHAAELSRRASDAASAGMSVVQESAANMASVNESVNITLGIIGRLEESSRTIGDIIAIINDIADQTNLLALNASIEAARAGEAGRGFAIVANEVKTLSAKTASSTSEISKIVKAIQKESQEATVAIGREKSLAAEGLEHARSSSETLNQIMSLVNSSTDMINQIATAAEELNATASEIAGSISQVSTTAGVVSEKMQHTNEFFMQVTEKAETIYSTVGKFSIGNFHDNIKGYAMEFRSLVTERLEKALESGELTLESLFSEKYEPIPNTSPQKYRTQFDSFFDRNISPIQEDILGRDKHIAFTIAVDRNGYCACHNLVYTRPLTGDPEKDKLHNRTKRIFNDRTGLKSARHTESFLLQTYMRDTGEIMNDLSMPITIKGRHWGGVRIGYRADH